jgi:hypothetical protein
MAPSQESTEILRLSIDNVFRRVQTKFAMLSDSEKKTLEGYLLQLGELQVRRIKIDRSIQRIETAFRSILALTESEPEELAYLEMIDEVLKPEGITAAVRKTLRDAGKPLTPVEVKERMPALGFPLIRYSNPLASIHTILKRLARTESVDAVEQDGKTAYQWVVPRIAKPQLDAMEQVLSRPLAGTMRNAARRGK